MQSDTLLEFDPEQVFSLVRKAGASADLLIEGQEQLNLKVKDTKLESKKVSATRIFGLRIIKDGRVGIAYSEAADPSSLVHLVDQGLVNARYGELDPLQQIQTLVSQPVSAQNHSFELAPSRESTSVAALLECLQSLEQRLLAQAHLVSVPYNGISQTRVARRIIASSGLDLTTSHQSYGLFAAGLAKRDTQSSMCSFGQVSRQFDGLNPAVISNRIALEAQDLLDGKPIANTRIDVVLQVEVLESLLQAFAVMLSGKAAQDKINPWRDHVNTIVASEHLTLVDQPQLAGMGQTPFDDEGGATRAVTHIAAGELQTLAHNSATAQALNAQPTAQAQRSSRSALGTGLHQMTILPGPLPHGQLLAGRVFEVIQVQGMHSGSNGLTGDFSFAASGYLWQDGKRVQVVKGVTLAGNFYQALHDIEVADQQSWSWQGSALLAQVRFKNVSLAGI